MGLLSPLTLEGLWEDMVVVVVVMVVVVLCQRVSARDVSARQPRSWWRDSGPDKGMWFRAKQASATSQQRLISIKLSRRIAFEV